MILTLFDIERKIYDLKLPFSIAVWYFPDASCRPIRSLTWGVDFWQNSFLYTFFLDNNCLKIDFFNWWCFFSKFILFQKTLFFQLFFYMFRCFFTNNMQNLGAGLIYQCIDNVEIEWQWVKRGRKKHWTYAFSRSDYPNFYLTLFYITH